jgi:uncharacterized membrane protein YciS (DUF1049 family)
VKTWIVIILLLVVIRLSMISHDDEVMGLDWLLAKGFDIGMSQPSLMWVAQRGVDLGIYEVAE